MQGTYVASSSSLRGVQSSTRYHVGREGHNPHVGSVGSTQEIHFLECARCRIGQMRLSISFFFSIPEFLNFKHD